MARRRNTPAPSTGAAPETATKPPADENAADPTAAAAENTTASAAEAAAKPATAATAAPAGDATVSVYLFTAGLRRRHGAASIRDAVVLPTAVADDYVRQGIAGRAVTAERRGR